MQNLLSRIQLRDLRLIRAISETGQLALAAEKLALTQPAASRMLAGIERTVGLALFSRHPKGMTPTPAGAVLARNAVALLNALDQTLLEVEEVATGRGGSARVGSVTGGAVTFVVPAIQTLKRTAAGSDIHVDVAPSAELIAGLLDGEFDFVLARIPAGVDARQFHVRRGRVELIRFMVRRDHPLADARRIGLDELAHYEWVIQAAPTPMRRAIDESFLAKGLAMPREIVNTTSLLVMIAYLASSDAIAPISREVADLLGPETFAGRIAVLDVADEIIITSYHLISRRNQPLNPLAARLHDMVFARLSGEAEASN